MPVARPGGPVRAISTVARPAARLCGADHCVMFRVEADRLPAKTPAETLPLSRDTAKGGLFPSSAP